MQQTVSACAVSVGSWLMQTRTTVSATHERKGPAGTAVVVVHGLGLSSRYLEPTLRLLASDFRVLAPDLPGFGRSTRPAQPLTLAELAGAVVAWMDAVDLELREGMTTDATDRLRRLHHPTLVVRGTRDTVVSAWWAQAVAELLPAGELVTLPGAPHGLPYSAAEALAAALTPFLTAHLGRTEGPAS